MPQSRHVEVTLLEVPKREVEAKSKSREIEKRKPKRRLIRKKRRKTVVSQTMRTPEFRSVRDMAKDEIREGSSLKKSTGRTSQKTGVRAATAEEMFRARIQTYFYENKRYPRMARRLQQQGKVVLRFLLRSDGTLLDVKVISESRYESLNEAAIRLVRSIDGRMKFPPSIDKTEWEFELPVEYQL